ncbi:MAG: phosphate ABC transporter ATP-binding protein [bacterium]|nr:MAG: phosphate ABC transporter ATP-binding protein [bacterium]
MKSRDKSIEISIQHLGKQKKVKQGNGEIKKLRILSDVTVDFCGGCVQIIIGPSGSGKTTLLRLLNKLEIPDEGKIFYYNNDLATIPPRQLRKKIGMVFQTPALFRGTIFDNISFGPQLYEEHISTDIAEQYLKVVGLGDIDANRDVDTLSVGQQQRVAIARALANKPKVLLLDEPTSALDPSAANNLLDLVKKINQQLGLGIIMVTHVMEHAKRIADTICFLVEGRVIECGEAASFFEQPKTELAKKFIRGEL